MQVGLTLRNRKSENVSQFIITAHYKVVLQSRFQQTTYKKYQSPAKHFLVKDLTQHNSNYLQYDYVGHYQNLPNWKFLEFSLRYR